MRNILDQIKGWHKDGQSAALASVIRTWGSSPRQAGSGMAVCSDGRIAGSVSGGCVEGAVIQAAQRVIKTRQPERLYFGVADDAAWEVGLACGGEIEVFVRPVGIGEMENWEKGFNLNIPFCAVLNITEESDQAGKELIYIEEKWLTGREELLLPWLENEPDVREILLSGKTAIITDPDHNTDELFVNVVLPPLHLIAVGGGHMTIPLVEQAETLGFEITVIDPRRIFGSNERFPRVSLLQEWPSSAFPKIEITPSSAVVMLTHDPKIDDPALIAALKSPSFYIGALGSKKTHEKRLERLRLEGVEEEYLEKIHAPIGLDLGGKTPPEIALSILAEIIQVWNNSR